MSRPAGYKHSEDSKAKMRVARAARTTQQVHTSETREKIGKGARKTRNAERLECPYGCGITSNNGAIARHILREHEFTCRISGCTAKIHKGRGLCYTHHDIDCAMRKYGLGVNDYIDQYVRQNGQCLLCYRQVLLKGTPGVSRVNVATIDHCHMSNRFRGLICNSCNIALGHVKDNVETLKRMVKYLQGEAL